MFVNNETLLPLPLLQANNSPGEVVVPVRWFRPPLNGETCPFTGLGHGSFYGKLLGGFAEAFVHVSLQAPGENRGTHLVFLPSIHRLLLALAENRGNSPIPDLIRTRFDHAKSIAVAPSWFRAPVNGSRCEYTGLSHSPFYQLLERAGKSVKVAQLQLPGETRASRLIWRPSLNEYLLNLAEEQVGNN